MDAATLTRPGAPWETRSVVAASTPIPARLQVAPRPAPVRVASPIAIPVVGAPIKGRHLVRAPWAEPLSAFAGVIVETQQVPDAWFRARAATGVVMASPGSAQVPAAIQPEPTSAPRPLVAIPVVAETRATSPAPAAPSTIPVRVVPVMVASRDAVPAARPVPVVTSLGTETAAISRTSAAPVEPVIPSPVPGIPTAARRGMLGRAVKLTVGLVVSLVAYEAAARIGRR